MTEPAAPPVPPTPAADRPAAAAERVIHDPPLPEPEGPTVRYRFAGDEAEVFPFPPIARVLQPGEEFDGPEGLVHARIDVADGAGWSPSLPDDARETPHDPAPTAPSGGEAAESAQDGAPTPGDGETPARPPEPATPAPRAVTPPRAPRPTGGS